MQDIFPTQLKRKVPPLVYMSLEQRIFWSPFGVLLSVLSLHGPWVGARDLNGYRLLVGSVLCPALASLYYLMIPFNPYQGFAARFAAMAGYDNKDRDTRRVVEIFASKAAKRFVLTTSLRICGLMLLSTVVIMAAQLHSLEWASYSPWFVPGILGGCIGSFITIGTEYIAWGLKNWAREATRNAELVVS